MFSQDNMVVVVAQWKSWFMKRDIRPEELDRREVMVRSDETDGLDEEKTVFFSALIGWLVDRA